MRVLVVGGTGTAGSPLATELVHRGHDVRVLSTRGRTAGIPGAQISAGGRRGRQTFDQWLAEAGADLVVPRC